jgi:hypothetical protein
MIRTEEIGKVEFQTVLNIRLYFYLLLKTEKVTDILIDGEKTDITIIAENDKMVI